MQQLRLGMLRDLILQPRNFQSLNGDPSLVACFRFKQWRRGGAGCNHSDHKENTRFYRNTEIKLIVLFFLVSNFALLWKHLTMCPLLQSYYGFSQAKQRNFDYWNTLSKLETFKLQQFSL